MCLSFPCSEYVRKKRKGKEAICVKVVFEKSGIEIQIITDNKSMKIEKRTYIKDTLIEYILHEYKDIHLYFRKIAEFFRDYVLSNNFIVKEIKEGD